MRSVIRRLNTDVINGAIIHEEAMSTYEVAEAIVGCRLDRRKNYAIIEGRVCESASYTGPCSGCSDGTPYAPPIDGAGCSECGYTGRRVNSWWEPVIPKAAQVCRECEGGE